jgi:integrase
MKTIKLNLSQTSIKLYKTDVEVHQLRDVKYPLYYRFSTVDRNTGTFYFVLYKNNKDNWLKLGRYPELSAKAELDKMFTLRKEAELKAIISAEPCFKQMDELLAWYLVRIESNKAFSEHTKKNQAIIINKHLIPRIGQVEVSELSLNKIDELLFQPLQQKMALSTIDNVFSTLNGALKRAITVKLIAINPISGMSLASFTNQRPAEKAGRLTQQHLLKLLMQLNSVTVTQQCLVTLLLLHGTRIGETVQAKWEHFDLKGRVWRIPATDTKNKKEHTLPLSEVAINKLKLYKKQQRSIKASTYLFPQKSNLRKPITGSQGSSMVREISKGKWSAHDIRKFARTWWMENGIDYMVGELLLNHTLNKLDKTYIQTLALNKCRDALHDWSEWLVKQGLYSHKTKPRYNPDRRKWKVS